jgi:hypothetical protein
MIDTIRQTVARALPLALVLATSAACAKKDAGNVAETAGGSIGSTTSASAATLRVSDVTLGSGVGTDKKVTGESATFKPNDTIYASVHTTGTGTNTPITARWTFGNAQQVSESTETVSPTGDAYTEFHVSKPGGWPVGKYTVHVLVNGQEVSAKEFTVQK